MRFDGTNENDFIEGTELRDIIDGKAGNDVIYADRGKDSARGGADRDVIYVSASGSECFGEDGDDIFIVTANLPKSKFVSLVDGGANIDIFDLSSLPVVGDASLTWNMDEEGVKVDNFVVRNFEELIGSDSVGNNFSFSIPSFTNVRGGSKDDTFYSTGVAVSLYGYGGSDRFTIEGALNRVDGGDGDDYVYLSNYADPTGAEIIGGSGQDSLSIREGTVNLRAGTMSLPDGRSGTLSSVENVEVRWGLCTVYGSDEENVLSTDPMINGAVSFFGFGGNDRLYGTSMNDVLDGGDGNDTISGRGTGGGAIVGDTIHGGNGDDNLTGSAKEDRIYGDGGNDIIEVVGGLAEGGDGIDFITINGLQSIARGGAGDDGFNAWLGDAEIDGGTGIDTVNYDYVSGDLTLTLANRGFATVIVSDGQRGKVANVEQVVGSEYYINDITGNNGKNLLAGGVQADQLNGGRGDDILFGENGADRLTGGKGADIFRYSTLDSAKGDHITDFARRDEDKIDLEFDANIHEADVQEFDFIGRRAFSGAAGELRYQIVGQTTEVSGDLNGDRVADFVITIERAFNLTAADFMI